MALKGKLFRPLPRIDCNGREAIAETGMIL